MVNKNRFMNRRISSNRIICVLIWLSILTSSFDIFLKFEVAGMSIRATQLVMMVVMLIYIMQCSGKVKIDRLHYPIIICLLLNTIFILNARTKMLAISYDIWFLFDIIEIIVMSYYLPQIETIQSIVRKYIYCFTTLAMVGIMQVILQQFGINFFVTQVSNMNRANGFSYEPSYYATYLIMGWVICMYLLEHSRKISLERGNLLFCTVVISLSLLLCTSRMGYLVMGIYIAWRGLISIRRINLRKLKFQQLFIGFCTIALVGVGIYVIMAVNRQSEFILRLLNGLGIAGTSSHSSGERISAVLATVRAFFKSPIIGSSLGGTDAAVAYLSGIKTITAEDTGSYSMCVFVEILLGLGVVGAVFFADYVYKIINQFNIVKKDIGDITNFEIVKSFVVAFVFELIILAFNQNILRPTLWMHIAILCSVYKCAEKKN